MLLSAVLMALVAVATSASLPLPPFLKPCSRNDPKLSECMLRSAIAAIPEIIKGVGNYKAPVLDPLRIVEILVQQPGGFTIILRNTDILGFKDVILKGVSIDLKKQKFHCEMFLPTISMIGDYDVDAKVLLLSIKGNGRSNITLVDLQLNYTSEYDLVKKDDGKEYMNPKNPHMAFKTGRAYMDFQNLFNGDKLLGETTNKFLNDNWETVIEEVGPAFSEAFALVTLTITGNIFDKTDFDDVFPDKV